MDAYTLLAIEIAQLIRPRPEQQVVAVRRWLDEQGIKWEE